MKLRIYILLCSILVCAQVASAQMFSAGPDLLYCDGGTAVMLSPDAGYVSYTWSPSSGLSDSTIAQPFASPVSTTEYTLTVSDGVNSYTDQITVHVATSNTLDLIHPTDTIVCNGEPVSLIKSFNGPVQWRELRSGRTFIADSIELLVHDTLMYELSVSGAGACMVSDTAEIISVAPRVQATVTDMACNSGFGQIELVELSAVAQPYNVTWNDGGTGMLRSALSTGAYQYTITDALGCITTSIVNVDEMNTITELSAFEHRLCSGDSTLVYLGGNGSQVVTFKKVTADIGTGQSTMLGSSSYPAVFGGQYKSAKQQFLYRASELVATGMVAGNISSLAFDVATLNGPDTYCNFRIQMKNCDKTELVDTFVTALQMVLYPTTFHLDTGMNSIELNDQFYWDGVSNIVVDICFDMTPINVGDFILCNPPVKGNSNVPYTETAFSSALYCHSDEIPQCGDIMAIGNSRKRPNIRFESNSYTGLRTVDTFFWSNASSLSDSNSLRPTLYPETSTTYTLNITDITGCVITDSVRIGVSDLVAQPSVSPAVVPCGVNEMELFANVSSSFAITQYQWSGLDEIQPLLGRDTMQGFWSLLEDTAWVELIVWDEIGCMHESMVQIEREPNCKSTISGFVFDDKNLDCRFDSLDTPLSEVWLNTFNGIAVSTDSTGVYTFQYGDTGRVLLQVNVPSNYEQVCANLDLVIARVPSFGSNVQVTDIPISNDTAILNSTTELERIEINVYPQPADRQLTISGIDGITEIALYDLMGRSVKREDVRNANYQISTNELGAGAYILSIANGNGKIFNKRVVVLH